MGLPKSKYSDPLHTPGNEFTLNGKDYIGWYIKTYQNKYYTGKVLDGTSKLIKPVEIKKLFEPVFSEQAPSPSIYAREKGEWKRFFIQKKSNLKIVEVDKDRFDTFKNTSQYAKGTLVWKIKGPADNQRINGYVYFGASHINRLNTEALENTIKGITEHIKDYSEFVE